MYASSEGSGESVHVAKVAKSHVLAHILNIKAQLLTDIQYI